MSLGSATRLPLTRTLGTYLEGVVQNSFSFLLPSVLA